MTRAVSSLFEPYSMRRFLVLNDVIRTLNILLTKPPCSFQRQKRLFLNRNLNIGVEENNSKIALEMKSPKAIS